MIKGDDEVDRGISEQVSEHLEPEDLEEPEDTAGSEEIDEAEEAGAPLEEGVVEEEVVEEEVVEEELAPSDEEESDQASLEELLAQRAARRSGEVDEDTDIISLVTETDAEVVPEVSTPARVPPVQDQEEFVCKSCFLVKPRVQLADPERVLCRDCV